MSQRVFPKNNKPVTSQYVPCGLPTGDVEAPSIADRANDLSKPQQREGYTILEILPPECWRMVLSRLDVKEVVRSARVSRGWQKVVQTYLQGIKRFNIKLFEDRYSIRHINNYSHINIRKTYDGYCEIKLNCNKKKYSAHLIEILRWFGPWATRVAVDCASAGDFERVVQNCPGLEHLEVYSLVILPLELAANCKALRSVTFRRVSELNDVYLGGLVANESIEELSLEQVDRVTGRFLRSLRSPLKTLEISQSKAFSLNEMCRAVEYLKGLTRLELNVINDYSEAYLLLDNMPNLEYLSLSARHCGDRASVVDDRLNRAVGRLSRLRFLAMRSNRRAGAALLAAAARGCRNLRALDVGNCPGVRGPAVANLCAALAPTLAEVYMHNNHNISREHVLAIIQCYHDIQDVNPDWLTKEIPQLVETSRLKLIWSGSDLYYIWN